MNFFTYIKDKIVPCVIIGTGFILLALMLRSCGVAGEIIIAAIVLMLMIVTAAAVWDYLRRRRFFRDMKETAENFDQVYYLSEIIDRPDFEEGRVVYDTLQHATKQMNDLIASYRLSMEEYQEYIETWIHEVKTPISAARLTLENSKGEVPDSLGRELDRVESYVEQALYFARSSSVERDFLVRSIKLDDLIKNVVRRQSRSFIENAITPRFEGLDVVVYSDAKWLEFIIGQIVGNAVKYHAKDPATVREIVFSAQREEAGFDSKQVVLTIADNGIGISASDVGRVFEKGFTGENGRAYAKSTGIGLYLCKTLCDKLKLPLSLQSTQGEGTEVRITFSQDKMHFL